MMEECLMVYKTYHTNQITTPCIYNEHPKRDPKLVI